MNGSMTKRQRLEKRYLKNLTLEIEKYLRKFLHSRNPYCENRPARPPNPSTGSENRPRHRCWSGAREIRK